MADPARARRLAKRISTIVASAIEYEIKDPRLARVTITDAKVTADLHDATVYYTVLPESLDSEPDVTGAAAALQSATGVLRTMVGQGTGVRFTAARAAPRPPPPPPLAPPRPPPPPPPPPHRRTAGPRARGRRRSSAP